ncbi:MAG: hypothetical protein UU81_C0010G0006 [Microgenomates group bacterium GW2011_GWC1_41_8]|uniref:Uncharacterized protein n=2 Tax=Candidatus Roizmaniibacteriota TaxID=1752723 RepID=A0A0G0TCX6_9BACT|nr:MAG: hypothetical protein UU14_C0003G0024 [Candidatus Roizmanbacteria bacterium GW2011_GWB1_40_7]KKR91625.1 MAG: hypothetical protein UU41_C0034G0009 [Candidatus Roizmanbacteria bacterium GW2011_GWA1_41_13]KKS24223.1 MAG: hypothetical protein UU81_C0010G0006 [Microgenomates group bacterium GW2011_GWC1_41_8]OGK49781.1 MAG: hypothetical protein A3A55_03460 [Candidatus Roizmanbacteria bacterium RIFCSPLOWO2_01_FULL_40_14]
MSKRNIASKNGGPEHNENDFYFDDCPVCQAMKKEGIKMQRVDDDYDKNLYENGFSMAPITKRQVKIIKKAVVTKSKS